MTQYTPMTILLISLIGSSATADQPITLGEVAFAGNGCPTEKHHPRYTLSRLNGQSLTIFPTQMALFSQADKHFVRKKCDIAIPVKVAEGYQVGISYARLQPFVALDSHASAKVSLSHGFAGSDFQQTQASYAENTHQSIMLNNADTQWAACGKDSNIRAKVSTILRSEQAKHAHIGVNWLSLGVVYRRCELGQ